MMGGGSSTPTGEDPSDFEDKTSKSAGIPTGSTSGESSSNTSSGSGGPGSVTPGDRNEIEAHAADLTNTININSPSAGPSPGEFSRQAFADGVQARRIEAGYDGHAATINDPNSEVIGGWSSFETGDVVDREPLTDAVDTAGRTAGHMEEVTLSSRGDRATDTAYVTKYDHNSNHRNAPRRENAHSQMAVYSAMDAMGVRTPRHAFDSQTKEVYVESVQRPGYDAELAERGELSTEYANRIEPDQMKDVMAANLVVGNGDIKADNLMVGEDGRVTAFDFDYTDTSGSLASVEAGYSRWMGNAIESVNQARDSDVGFGPSAVVDRAEEIATQLDKSGAVDRVAEAASQYDDFFENEDPTDYGGWETDQIDRVSDRVRKHVTNWSTASDKTVL